MAALTPFSARRLVVKIGSALLVDRETGQLRGNSRVSDSAVQSATRPSASVETSATCAT